MAFFCASSIGGAAWAQTSKPVDPKIRAAARKLGVEGIHLYNKGDYEQALDKFDRALKLLPRPTLGVRAARCLKKLGRLVEAAERYGEVAQLPVDPRSPAVHRRAKREAEAEREKLMPRIPSLEIVVNGPHGDDGISVLLDGEDVPMELVGAEQPVDPGEHEVRVQRGDLTLTETASVEEGGRASVELTLPELPPPPVLPPPKEATDLTMWSYVALGIGGGGIIAGVVNGAIALSQQADLEERCPDRSCPPDAHAAADVFDMTRYATTIGLIIGGAGLAAGVTLLVLGDVDDDEQQDPVDAAILLQPAGVGLRLRF